MTQIVHFVGFKDDRYWSAVKVFGPPHYIHTRWDACALRELDDGDLVVFADGPHDHKTHVRCYIDQTEDA